MSEKNVVEENKIENVDQEKIDRMIKEGERYKTLFIIAWFLVMILPFAIILYNNSLITI